MSCRALDIATPVQVFSLLEPFTKGHDGSAILIDGSKSIDPWGLIYQLPC